MYTEIEKLRSWIAQMIHKIRQKLLNKGTGGNIITILKVELFGSVAERAIIPNLIKVQVQEGIRGRDCIFPGGTL